MKKKPSEHLKIIAKVLSLMLPAAQAQLRIHGNGFLQVELADGNKMHVWHPTLPRQKVQTLEHNHNHAFTSHVLVGALVWEEFHIGMDTLNGEWKPYATKVRVDKDTTLEDSGHIVRKMNRRAFSVVEGTRYDWPLDTDLYHALEPSSDFAITYVVRGSTDTSAIPKVLVPLGVEPDNEFDRYAHNDIATLMYGRAEHKLVTMLRLRS